MIFKQKKLTKNVYCIKLIPKTFNLKETNKT